MLLGIPSAGYRDGLVCEFTTPGIHTNRPKGCGDRRRVYSQSYFRVENPVNKWLSVRGLAGVFRASQNDHLSVLTLILGPTEEDQRNRSTLARNLPIYDHQFLILTVEKIN